MKKIVTVGGGTGSYTILSGLKTLENVELTALVSMADDGGSTGLLRDELGVLPPGDVRQCLVALSEHSDIVRKLMSYRFAEGTLKGHSFGNIFLAALEKVTGNFVEGVEIASEILKVKGRVFPITNNVAQLCIELGDGTILEGENVINHEELQSANIERIFYAHGVSLNEHARDAIMEADYIIFGPGNYYCSLVPSVIVEGFKETIQKSKAKLIFPVNLTNKQGHTLGWNVSDYVSNLEKYIGTTIHVVLLNNEKPSEDQEIRYQLQEGAGFFVLDNLKEKAGQKIVRRDLLSKKLQNKTRADTIPAERGFIRHDSIKFAKAVEELLLK